MFTLSAMSMLPFLHDRMRVAADEHAAADPNAAIRLALGVDQAVVVDDDVAADVNLVRVAKHDVLTEHHVAPARSEQPRIQQLSQQQAERAGPGLCDHHDQFVFQQRRAGPAVRRRAPRISRGSTCRAQRVDPAPGRSDGSPSCAGRLRWSAAAPAAPIGGSEPAMFAVPAQGPRDAFPQANRRRVADFSSRPRDVERAALREEIHPPPVDRRLDPKRRADEPRRRRRQARTATPADASAAAARRRRRR